jgi:hypothetical protein
MKNVMRVISLWKLKKTKFRTETGIQCAKKNIHNHLIFLLNI